LLVTRTTYCPLPKGQGYRHYSMLVLTVRSGPNLAYSELAKWVSV
jgi:hypothetical protein